MKYLKKFEDESEYLDSKYLIEQPSVSWIVDTNDIVFMEYTESMIVAKFDLTSQEEETTVSVPIVSVNRNGKAYYLGDDITKSVIYDGENVTIRFSLDNNNTTNSSLNMTGGTVHTVKYSPTGSGTINNWTVTIGSNWFSGLTYMTKVIIPKSITLIELGAFKGCTGLNSIICLAETPPTLGSNTVFSNTNDCPIYVPSQSVNAYKTADKWSTYADRFQAIPSHRNDFS